MIFYEAKHVQLVQALKKPVFIIMIFHHDCGNRFVVYHFYRVLVLHLKRFAYSENQGQKVVENVTVPKFLTLKKYCNEETSPPHPQSISLRSDLFLFLSSLQLGK